VTRLGCPDGGVDRFVDSVLSGALDPAIPVPQTPVKRAGRNLQTFIVSDESAEKLVHWIILRSNCQCF